MKLDFIDLGHLSISKTNMRYAKKAPDVSDILCVVIGETLSAGSDAVDVAGLQIGVEMDKWWEADDALFAGLRDKEVLNALVAEIGGAEVAAANAKAKGATLKAIVRDHLEGANGRAKVARWVPRWMAFPPAAYTARGVAAPDRQAA